VVLLVTDFSHIPIDELPAVRLAAAVASLGERDVVDRSVALLAGLNAGDEFLVIAGGRHAIGVLDGAPPLYWPEVWGARALLYVWHSSAEEAVMAGLQNQAWRVREMCCRVVAHRALPFAEHVRPLLTDDTARVRAAAARTLGEVGAPSDVDTLKNLFRDSEIDVRRAAQQAISRLEKA
jgi:HEAT repeat protein